jgi:hypothetical protein
MHGSRPTSMSRGGSSSAMILEDLLVLDAGCVEKERNRARVDRRALPRRRRHDPPEHRRVGGYYDDAYVQVVDGHRHRPVRDGGPRLHRMDNPQTDVRFAGYGISPLENLVVSRHRRPARVEVQRQLLREGRVPEGILNLGEDVAPEDVDAFRLYWMNEIMGRPWALPIIGGKGVEFMQWRDSNRDMQFMEYQDWLLQEDVRRLPDRPQETSARSRTSTARPPRSSRVERVQEHPADPVADRGNGPTDDEVGKVHPAGRDRAPAATAREDDLIDVLADAQRRLVRDLAETLELPAADLEDVLA